MLAEQLPPLKFWKDVQHVLLSAPARHQMLISCAHKALTAEYGDDLKPIMFALRSAGSSVDGAVAFHGTPCDFRAYLAGEISREVVAALFACLDDVGRARVGGVSEALGPLEAVETFAEAYSTEFCSQVKATMDAESLLLDCAPARTSVDGCLRVADSSSAHLATLAAWRGKFVEDAFGTPFLPSQQENFEAVSKLAGEGDLFYWQVDDDVPVAMCCMTRRLGTAGCSISLVFTDRQHRGKGYAAGMISAFCEEKLKSLQFVALFADTNSSFNTIALYERAGFRRTGLHGERRFVRAADS